MQKFILLAVNSACWGKSWFLPFTDCKLYFSRWKRKLQRHSCGENLPLSGVGWLKLHLTMLVLASLPKVTPPSTGFLLNPCLTICVHIAAGYEPSEDSTPRSPLKLHVVKTCLPFLRISSESKPDMTRPWVLKSGSRWRRKGKGIWDSFCLCQHPESRSALLPVILLYDGGNYRYWFEKYFDILR